MLMLIIVTQVVVCYCGWCYHGWMADVTTVDVTLIARNYGGFGGDCPRLWHSSVWVGKHCDTDADFKLTPKFNNLMTPILQIFSFHINLIKFYF